MKFESPALLRDFIVCSTLYVSRYKYGSKGSPLHQSAVAKSIQHLRKEIGVTTKNVEQR